MSVYLALLIPLIVTLVFYFLKKSEFVWWEFFIPFGSVLVMVVVSKLIIDHTAVQFTEYWGSSVTSVYEEEPWNEWIHKTCSQENCSGSGKNRSCTTTYYDCSYQEDHQPQWYMDTNNGERQGITEKQYEELCRQFGTARITIDGHHNYSPHDRAVGSSGTKFQGKRVGETSYVYKTIWNKSDATRKAYTSIHTYENRIKASDLTIFNISLVSEKQADSLKLFKYPDIKSSGFFSSTNSGLEFPTILGAKVSNETQEKFRKLNGKFGVSNQVRLWILVFENRPQSIAYYQENYWVKGNKNELVVCIGKKGEEIQWSHAFSWATSSDLTVAVKNEVLNLYTYRDSVVKLALPVLPLTNKKLKSAFGKAGKKLPEVLPLQQKTLGDTIIKIKSANPVLTEKTWDDFNKYLNQNLGRFKRRHFKEFNYLTVEPSKTAVIIVYILALILSIAANVFVTTNDIQDEDDGKVGFKKNRGNPYNW